MRNRRYGEKTGTTMTDDKAFVDTNVLLRVMQIQVPGHREAEALIQRFSANDVELWISRQVIREYLVQVTHPRTFASPLSIDELTRQIQAILSLFHVADDTAEVTAQLVSLLRAYPTRGKQIHDANIVATMLAVGIDTLLTFNLEDFKRTLIAS